MTIPEKVGIVFSFFPRTAACLSIKSRSSNFFGLPFCAVLGLSFLLTNSAEALNWTTHERKEYRESIETLSIYSRGFTDTEATYENLVWIDCKSGQYAGYHVLHELYDDNLVYLAEDASLPFRTLGDEIDAARLAGGELTLANISKTLASYQSVPLYDESTGNFMSADVLKDLCLGMTDTLPELEAGKETRWRVK